MHRNVYHGSVLSCFSLSRKNLPSWLGIFAIMMLFIGPAVSRALDHGNTSAHEMAMASMSDADMHDISMMDMSQMDMSHPMMGDHAHMAGGMMMDDVACGYCVMLLHVPLLELKLPANIILISLFSRAPPERYFVKFVPHAVLRDVQPRAPPPYRHI